MLDSLLISHCYQSKFMKLLKSFLQSIKLKGLSPLDTVLEEQLRSLRDWRSRWIMEKSLKSMFIPLGNLGLERQIWHSSWNPRLIQFSESSTIKISSLTFHLSGWNSLILQQKCSFRKIWRLIKYVTIVERIPHAQITSTRTTIDKITVSTLSGLIVKPIVGYLND